MLKKSINKPTNNNILDKSDCYSSANSIIEQGDSVNNIIDPLKFNLLLSIIMLFTTLFIIYIYYLSNVKNKSILIYFTWVILVLISLSSTNIAYNILEDIGVMSSISKNSPHYLRSSGETDKIDTFLTSNFSFSLSSLSSLLLLFALYVNTKIVNSSIEFKYLISVLVKYSVYLNKLIRYISNSNKLWLIVLFIFLLVSSMFSTSVALF